MVHWLGDLRRRQASMAIAAGALRVGLGPARICRSRASAFCTEDRVGSAARSAALRATEAALPYRARTSCAARLAGVCARFVQSGRVSQCAGVYEISTTPSNSKEPNSFVPSWWNVQWSSRPFRGAGLSNSSTKDSGSPPIGVNVPSTRSR